MNSAIDTSPPATNRPSRIGGFLIVALSVAASLLMIRSIHPDRAPLQNIAGASAFLALLGTIVAVMAEPWCQRFGTFQHSHVYPQVFRVVALLLGVTAAIILAVTLVMRAIVVAVTLIQLQPWKGLPTFGFDEGGVVTLMYLCGSCLIATVGTRDRRFLMCLLGSAMTLGGWALLLSPSLRSAPAGGFERNNHTVLIAMTLSLLLMLGVLAAEWMEGLFAVSVKNPPSDSRPPMEVSPGLTPMFIAVGLIVILLVCYHLAVPIRSGGGFRLTALLATLSAWTSAAAAFLHLRRRWSLSVADVGMALASLGCCGICTLLVPEDPVALADRYPMVFNALMFGWAISTLIWTWVGTRSTLRVGALSTPQAQVIASVARRFAFLTAALALVVGAVMAVWPRLPAIAITDDSLSRVCAGLSANLFLLWVMLWCGRRMHRLTFQILTVLSVVSAAGFLTARMLPFTPRFG